MSSQVRMLQQSAPDIVIMHSSNQDAVYHVYISYGCSIVLSHVDHLIHVIISQRFAGSPISHLNYPGFTLAAFSG